MSKKDLPITDDDLKWGAALALNLVEMGHDIPEAHYITVRLYEKVKAYPEDLGKVLLSTMRETIECVKDEEEYCQLPPFAAAIGELLLGYARDRAQATQSGARPDENHEHFRN